jgi:hypothetical protein
LPGLQKYSTTPFTVAVGGIVFGLNVIELELIVVVVSLSEIIEQQVQPKILAIAN